MKKKEKKEGIFDILAEVARNVYWDDDAPIDNWNHEDWVRVAKACIDKYREIMWERVVAGKQKGKGK